MTKVLRRERPLEVVLAQPRGFCAGVERAIEIVEAALRTYGAPVYVRHEIVHNPRVVENLKAKGVRFVERIEEVPPGMVTVFSAHGVSAGVEREAGGPGAAHHRRHLPARVQGARGGTALRRRGSRHRADRA